MHTGITGNALLLLLKCHLTDCTQRCEVNGSISHESSVKCGVLQGSILGPVEFIVVILQFYIIWYNTQTHTHCESITRTDFIFT